MVLEKISDEKIEEILRLASEEGLNQGEIAEQVGVSRATAGKYIREVRKPLRARNRARIAIRNLNELCEAITPLILEKLRNGNPGYKNENKEDQEMSNEDVERRVQEALDRKSLNEKLDQILSLKDEIKTNTIQIKSLCEQFPGLCRVQESIDSRLKKSEATKPGTVLGTELTLGELLKSEKSQENLAEKYMSETGLLYALKRCTGAECQILRERAREQGIRIQVKGKGSMPGSSGWKDIE